MDVSVIVPTRDRRDFVRDFIAQLRHQTLDPRRYEIIIVDNGSTDGTAEMLASMAGELANLRCVRESSPGLHCGRHRGLAEAQAAVLVFADDDILPDPSWLEGHVESFRDSAVVMAGGNARPEFEAKVPGWLERLWLRPAAGGRMAPALSLLELPGPARDIDPGLVWGCNFAIRRQTLLEVGGFHPDGMPDALLKYRGDGESHVSWEVARRGGRCRFNPAASVRHRVPETRMTMEYFERRAFRQGISDSYTELRKRGGRVSALRRSVERLAFLRRTVRANVEDMFERDLELRELARRCRRGHVKGVSFHREIAAADPELIEWITRPNYLEKMI